MKETARFILLAMFIGVGLGIVSSKTGKTNGEINVVTDLGCVGDGQTDNGPKLQASIDGLTGNATYVFPPGDFIANQPIIAGKYAPRFRGAGSNVTSFGPGNGRTHPALVYGIRQTDKGNSVTNAHRPDVFGILDSSITNAPGNLTGFRTNANTWMQAVGTIQCGMRSKINPNDVCYDNYGEMNGLTLETCFSLNNVNPGDNFTICGFGWGNPWSLIGAGDGSQRLAMLYTMVGDTSPQIVYIPIPSPTPKIIRLRFYFDITNNTVGVSVNGQTTIQNKPLKNFTPNLGRYPFYLGTDINSAGTGIFKVPDITFYGLRVSNMARTTEPANDALRYFGQYDVNTIFYLPLTGPPARYLYLQCGAAADGVTTAGFIHPCSGSDGGIVGGDVRDITFHNGSLSLGAVLRFNVQDCEFVGFMPQAINSIPLVASYPVYISHCNLTGTDSPLNLYRCDVSISNLDLLRSGDSSARFIGCNVNAQNMMFDDFSGKARNVINLMADQYGGNYSFTNLNIDSEATNFTESIITCETHPYTTTGLFLKQINVSQVGPNASIVNLIGHQPNAAYHPAYINVAGLYVYSTTYKTAISGAIGWTGFADLCTLPVPSVTGTGITIYTNPAWQNKN